jgi:hypothetical protein
LNISPAGTGSLILQWYPGSLLQADSLLGPWTTNTAASPYTVIPHNFQMFFKTVN